MLQLDKLFNQRTQFNEYREQLFVKPKFDTGLRNPFLFIVDKRATLTVSNFTVSLIEDRGYDIHVISTDQQVLFYLIDVKYPHVLLVSNGIVIRSKEKNPLPEISDGIKVRYNMDYFQVLSNKSETCTVFGRNITTDPKT